MAERTNQEWLADLRGPGRDQALADLRSLLLRGLRYALSNYSVREADREDLTQEALLRIMAGLDSFRGESRFTTWAHKIAVHAAFGELRRLASRCRLLAVSSVYETLPVGKTDQPNFLNAAALVETDMPATELKAQVLQIIEQELGRVRTADRNAPRTIDLDIALFGDQALDLGTRRIPEPDILQRPHVAVPLADLSPRQRHPETGQTLQEIARSLPSGGLVRRLDVLLWPQSHYNRNADLSYVRGADRRIPRGPRPHDQRCHL